MKKKIIVTVIMVAVLSLAACSKKPVEDGNTKNPEITQAAQQDDKQKDTTPVKPDPTTAPKEDTTAKDNKSEQPAQPTEAPKATPTAEPKPTENPKQQEDTTSVEEHLNDDQYVQELADSRARTWKATFLIWVPEFKNGVFTGSGVADTFDYAYFALVGGQDVVDSYVDALINVGYKLDDESGSNTKTMWYYASNADDWCVTVDYDKANDALRIGSGFNYPGVSANGRQIDNVWENTNLLYVPVFTEGILESHTDLNSDSDFAVAIFSGVGVNEARAYIELLKNAGYTLATETGDVDGTIWYLAQNAAGYTCDFQFSDGVCRVGCGK